MAVAILSKEAPGKRKHEFYVDETSVKLIWPLGRYDVPGRQFSIPIVTLLTLENVNDKKYCDIDLYIWDSIFLLRFFLLYFFIENRWSTNFFYFVLLLYFLYFAIFDSVTIVISALKRILWNFIQVLNLAVIILH